MASSDSVELNSSEGSVGKTTCSSSDGKTSEVVSESSCLGSGSSDGKTSSGGKKASSNSSSSSERLPGASDDEVHGGKLDLVGQEGMVGWGMGRGGVGPRLHDMC